MSKITSLQEFFERWGDAPVIDTNAITHLGVPGDENFWKWREYYRTSLEYTKVLFETDPTVQADHFVHVAANDPLLVAFTPDEKHGRADRKKTMKVGKYLKTYYPDKYTDNEIRSLANRHRAHFSPPELHFTTDPDMCEKVYEEGPRSCMQRKSSHIRSDCTIHPARVYSTDTVGLAYILKNNRITARTVVNLAEKQYVRIYGDADVMQQLLEKEGYKPGSILGQTLRLIQHDERRIVLPYLDGTNNVKIEEDHLRVVQEPYNQTDILPGPETGGFRTYAPDHSACHHCRTLTPNDELRDAWHPNQAVTVCNDCYHSNYTENVIVDTDGTTATAWTPSVCHIDGRLYAAPAVARECGFEYDEILGWHPLEEFVTSAITLTRIHRDRAIPVDEDYYLDSTTLTHLNFLSTQSNPCTNQFLRNRVDGASSQAISRLIAEANRTDLVFADSTEVLNWLREKLHNPEWTTDERVLTKLMQYLTIRADNRGANDDVATAPTANPTPAPTTASEYTTAQRDVRFIDLPPYAWTLPSASITANVVSFDSDDIRRLAVQWLSADSTTEAGTGTNG